MKSNLHTNPLLFKMFLLITCFMLVIVYNKSQAAGVPMVSHTVTRVAINFKQDMERDALTIRIKSSTAAVMQLFIFTLDGILVKEVNVSAQTITTIQGLKKGYYLYECFDNDQRMKSGNLLIK